jgi:dihydrofolate reductase
MSRSKPGGPSLRRQAGSKVFVTGGSAVYAAALPYADRLYITEVDTVLDGDASFPEFDETAFAETHRVAMSADAKNEHDFVIRTLERRR